jgi:serine protease
VSRDPLFESLSVVVVTAPRVSPAITVARLLARVGLKGWTVEPVPSRPEEFELLPPARRRRLSPGAAWDITYAVRDQPEVVSAEPLFRYSVADQLPPPRRRASGGGDAHHPKTAGAYEWSLEKSNVIAAWKLFGDRVPGAGATVGHPDTGYTPHPELSDPARLLVNQGFDFEDDDPNPLDDLDDELLEHPGHGTGTGSVIASNRGAAVGNNAPAFVSGAAPGASLIPIRTTTSVILLSMRGLRRAIDHATTRGAHVISISLGGPWPSGTLRRALDDAVRAGVIVVAAAGNQVRLVVFPAAFEAAIAVAASTITDEPWSGSSRGDAVDITAPGASVWRAQVRRDSSGRLMYDVERGSGTSFATATTAGVAALWVSYHGWSTLARRYGAENIARVFKTLLQSTCRTPAGWDTENYGPGIIDAAALLSAPLPATPPARKLRDARRPAVAMDATGIESLVHLMPEASRTAIERAIAELLDVDERALPRALQGVGDELAFQLAMHPALLATVQRRARAPRAAAGPVVQRQVLALGRREVSGRLRATIGGGRGPRRQRPRSRPFSR